MDKTAQRCNEVLKIAKRKNFKKHTCYNCAHLIGPGDGVTDACEKGHKLAMYLIKFGPFKNAIYHRNTESWICKDKKWTG
jgi:hypothetical protein